MDATPSARAGMVRGMETRQLCAKILRLVEEDLVRVSDEADCLDLEPFLDEADGELVAKKDA